MKIFLYSFIGDFDNTASYIKDQLADAGDDPIELHINSPGGDVFEGFAIYNLLRSVENEITVNIDGLAGSIASLIALSGNTVNMSEVGDFFIHNASTWTGGNKELLEDQIKVLEQIDNTLVKVYQAKTGERKRKIIDLMKAETHFTADEAKKIGFVDNIINPIKAVAFLTNNDNMKRVDFDKALSNAKAFLGFQEPADEDQRDLVDSMAEAAEKQTDENLKARIDDAKGKEGAEILTAEMVTFKEFDELRNQYTPLFKSVLNLLEQLPTTEEMEAKIEAVAEDKINDILRKVRSKTVAPRNATAGLQNNDDEAEKIKAIKAEERRIYEENEKKRQEKFKLNA